MPTLQVVGEQLKEIDALALIPQNEADILQIFGKIRSGKTYVATADILKHLKRGDVVYANWRVQFDGYDERNSWWCRFKGVLGLKKHFFVFGKENFRYLPVDENFFDTFARLTDCVVYLDEGHIAFNSYEMTKMKLDKQASILHTGHFNRAIRIVSQRPTAIHVVMRANVNVFVQVEKVFQFRKFILFRKTEYEEMTNSESVDLEQPSRSSLYWGRKKVFSAYDSKYLRGNTPTSQENYVSVWYLTWFDSLRNFIK